MGGLNGWDGRAFVRASVGSESGTGLTAHFEFMLSGTGVRATGYAVAVPSREDVQLFWNSVNSGAVGRSSLRREFPLAYLAERDSLYGVEPLKPYLWLEELSKAADAAMREVSPWVKQCQAGRITREELHKKLKMYEVSWAFKPTL